MESKGARHLKHVAERTSPSTWSALAVLALAMAGGGITARLEAGPRYDWLLLMTAMGLTVAVAMRLLADNAAEHEAQQQYAGDPHKDVLDSAGTIVVSVDLDGHLDYANPAAERALGYHDEELMELSGISDLLAPGEADRMVGELQRLCRIERGPAETREERRETYAEIVRHLAPSMTPAMDTQLRRKDGSLLPARVHVSSLRNTDGAPVGMVVIAVPQSPTGRKELLRRETRDRFRDVFENSSEMIATLDLAGRILYANPAWKRCFGSAATSAEDEGSFEDSFGPGAKSDAARLLQRAMAGETIDRAPLRNESEDGHLVELEMSLHQRRRAGKPMAVQCLARDVTQQKRREQRLAVQLLVSQILGENLSAEKAAARVLEALCVSQGWDVAVRWDVNQEERRLEFGTAWGLPGSDIESFIQQSMARPLNLGEELPGRAWKEGKLVWIMDLDRVQGSDRSRAAVERRMVSGWAAPVQVGNSVLAVLEFYSHLRLREDAEISAAMETVASSLGQMLARTRERERAEELSRQQKILLHSVADGICGIDRNGLVRFANPAATRLLGAPAASLIGKTVHELLHGAAPTAKQCSQDCNLRRATMQRVPSTGENTIYRANGTGFPAEYFLNPIMDQGRFSGSVLSFRDISQRFALDRLKDEFVSTVSHELRTPLTSIRGALGLLTSGMLGEVNEKATNLLRIALTNSDRLVRLINDILDLERAQGGREPLVFRPVQMADLVRQAMDGMQLVAEQAGVMLIHDKTQVEVMADPDRMLQVLTNLLSNAVKFSQPNSAISVMLRPGSSGVTLSVIDQGRGIPADKLEAVFGRFQQVDASDSRQKGGSGLGLAICRAIVTQHSGRIWAERNPTRGTTFRVFLPYHPAAAATRKATNPDSPGQGVVLLASATVATRPVLGAQLADYGYRILETDTTEQTVAAAHDGVEVIVLDGSFTAKNGWGVIPDLRRTSPESHTPLLLLSLDHHQTAEARGDVRNGAGIDDAAIRELTRALAVPGELLRILVVDDDAGLAVAVRDSLKGERTDVLVASSHSDALEKYVHFKPHAMALNLGLAGGEAFNVVDRFRERELLGQVPMLVYSGAEFSSTDKAQIGNGMAQLLGKGKVQPHQLETLILTMLRNTRQVDEGVADASALREA
jgi:PAS domain S-box-containing protein